MAVPKAQTLIAGRCKTKKAFVPMRNAQNALSLIGGHNLFGSLSGFK
jgi:hypothetical protein